MIDFKQEKVLLELKGLAGEFLARHSNRTSLVTVTNLFLSTDLKRAEIFLSVIPNEKEKAVVQFANRLRGEFGEYIRAHSKMHRLPHIVFSPDVGEQNRQRIEELLHEENETDSCERLETNE